MYLPNGNYKTAKGSTVELSGTNGGIAKAVFDWFEESACCDCKADPYPMEYGEDDWRLTWHCEYCDGGSAKLSPVSHPHYLAGGE